MVLGELGAWLTDVSNVDLMLDLYDDFGTNDTLKARMRNNVLAYRDIITQELQSYYNTHKSEDVPENFVGKQKLTGIWVEDNYDGLPEEIKALVQYGKKLFKETSYLHQKLNTIVDPHELAVTVHTLLDKDDEKEAVFAKIDFYKEHKQLPLENVSVDLNSLDGVDLVKRRNNIRSRVSKLKKDKGKVVELSESIRELALLEKLIDGIN